MHLISFRVLDISCERNQRKSATRLYIQRLNRDRIEKCYILEPEDMVQQKRYINMATIILASKGETYGNIG